VYTDMEQWSEIRRRVLVEGLSRLAACREYGLHWHTLMKMLEHSEPPGYRAAQPRAKPKIGPFLEVIAEILRQDQAAPRKQRHTKRRIFERLKAEHGYSQPLQGHSLATRYAALSPVMSMAAPAEWRRPALPLLSALARVATTLTDGCAAPRPLRDIARSTLVKPRGSNCRDARRRGMMQAVNRDDRVQPRPTTQRHRVRLRSRARQPPSTSASGLGE
jgi:hypothetical protein